MELVQFGVRRLLAGIPLLLGVTFVSFLLMVYFGPDKTYDLVGKNPTQEQIDEVRASLGYDRPFLVRYADYLRELATLDFGASDSTNERVIDILRRTIPVSLAMIAPGFILGNLLGVLLGLFAAYHRGGWIDKAIMGASVVGMSVSFVIVIIVLQVALCTPYGLNWFPVRGWDVGSLADYAHYVTVPTLSTVFVSLGYNTRFYRAVLVEEMGRDHVRTARAFGHAPSHLLLAGVLRNSLIPILTRIMFSIPLVVVSGSLLIETFFGIPGVGQVTYDAIVSGDQPVLKAVVGLTAAMFVVILMFTDILYRAVDPRVVLH